MTKIKFRAWDIFDKVMVYGNEHNGNDNWDGIHCSSIQMVNDRFEEYRYKWLQYTGSVDINGKKIYEDDIVRLFVSTDPEMPEYISYVSNFHGAFTVKCMGMEIYTDYFVLGWLEEYDIEVIGNLHENPELLPKECLSF